MKKYRIAFFTADWNYELVESTLHGLKQYVDEHPEYQLCVFDCFGKEGSSQMDRSEFAIYDLPDLRMFDGVLIQGSQIVNRRMRETLGQRVRAAGIPAVTVDCPIEDFTLLRIDDRKAQYDIARHFISVHGARRLVYLTGLLENGCPEGDLRMQGFLDACREAGIPKEDVSVFPCTWRTEDGAQAAEKWLESGRALPDAFLCANDEMALGIISVLQSRGYQIPGDVLVGGFDNVNSAELSSPALTTIHRDCGKVCYYGMELLAEKIRRVEAGGTQDMPDHTDFEYSLILSESCGCGGAGHPDYIRGRYYEQTRYLKNFYTAQDEMAAELFEAVDLQELMAIMEKYQGVFGCDTVWLCINDYYYDNYDKQQWTQDSETYGKEMVLAAFGNERNTRTGGRRRIDPYGRFAARELLPAELMEKERFLIFYPLHYNTYSIGYLVMNSISEMARLNLHKSIFSFLEIAIENVRKKCLLRQFNAVLDDLYVHDSMTGLYNRHGYDRFGEKAYQRFLAKDGGARILFIDLDGLKQINDNFGHDSGDEAILAAAAILKTVFGPDAFMMRYGGDEFLVITSDGDDDLIEKLKQAVEGFNRFGEACFTLSLSTGVIHAAASDGLTLEEYVEKADELMYRHKKQKKTG
ncbi:MAG: GGDEF domain-containing protein [Blautia sp.]|nr:GGDEF domain-containing protein [Blautia sp.]